MISIDGINYFFDRDWNIFFKTGKIIQQKNFSVNQDLGARYRSYTFAIEKLRYDNFICYGVGR